MVYEGILLHDYGGDIVRDLADPIDDITSLDALRGRLRRFVDKHDYGTHMQ